MRVVLVGHSALRHLSALCLILSNLTKLPFTYYIYTYTSRRSTNFFQLLIHGFFFSWVSGNLEFGGADYPGIGVNSIHAGIMAVEASTKSNLVNNFDDDDDDGPVFFKRKNAASRQNQVHPDVRKPSSSTFNGQNSNAQKGKTLVPSSKQTVDRENEEASQDDQDRGKKRTNDESEINKEVVGGSKGKKGKLGDAAKLSKQIDRLVEVVESTSTTPVYRSSQGTSIPEVMEVVATLPGAEKGSQLWWFATELFCSQDKRDVFCYDRS